MLFLEAILVPTVLQVNHCVSPSNFHPVNHRGVVIWQGRLLEQSRTAGILEGKIIASTEENKVSSLTRWRLWGNRWYGYGMMKQKMFSRISSNNSIISSRWWQLKYFRKFHPDPWKNDPIWRAYFSNGLKPPTRVSLKTVAHEVVVEGIDMGIDWC